MKKSIALFLFCAMIITVTAFSGCCTKKVKDVKNWENSSWLIDNRPIYKNK
jgi:hypothetical protein